LAKLIFRIKGGFCNKKNIKFQINKIIIW
jgi:hypothetical protein